MCLFETFPCTFQDKGCDNKTQTYFRQACAWNPDKDLATAMACPNSLPRLPCLGDEVMYTCWACRTMVYEDAWYAVNGWNQLVDKEINGVRETKLEQAKRENTDAFLKTETQARLWAAQAAGEDGHQHSDRDKNNPLPIKWLKERMPSIDV